MSATPIPRTLNMAMSGIRDMSVIEEAPGDRVPVQSYVIEYDEGIVAEAIDRELRRGGQVYYLYNNWLVLFFDEMYYIDYMLMDFQCTHHHNTPIQIVLYN